MPGFGLSLSILQEHNACTETALVEQPEGNNDAGNQGSQRSGKAIGGSILGFRL
jgi:hypothetical protein